MVDRHCLKSQSLVNMGDHRSVGGAIGFHLVPINTQASAC